MCDYVIEGQRVGQMSGAMEAVAICRVCEEREVRRHFPRVPRLYVVVIAALVPCHLQLGSQTSKGPLHRRFSPSFLCGELS